MSQHSDEAAQLKQYYDEIREFFRQQQAQLEQHYAMCAQQLFQTVSQGQLNQFNPQMSGGSYIMHPPSIPQETQQQGSQFPPNYPHNFYYNNYRPEYQYPPHGYAQPSPAGGNVVYKDMLNGTRITVSESPNNSSSRHSQNTSRNEGHFRELPMNPNPALNLQSHSNIPRYCSNGAAEGQIPTSSPMEGQVSPRQLNLHITIAPVGPPTTEAEYQPTQQSALSSTTTMPETLQSQDQVHASQKYEQPKHGRPINDLDNEHSHLFAMLRRRSIIKDALRTRRKELETSNQH